MSTNPNRIDVHYHLIPEPYARALKQRGVHGASYTKFPRWTPELALEQMDKNGIAAAITSLSTPGVWFGDVALARELSRISNEFQARMMADHPLRFGAFAFLPLPDVDGALVELAYALDELGHDGVMLFSDVDGHYLGDPAYEELFAELDRRRALVFIHPHDDPRPERKYPLLIPLLERPVHTTRAVVDLLYSGRLGRYPNIRYILAHGGGTVPFTAHRIACGLARSERTIAGDRGRTNGSTAASAAASAEALQLLRRMYFDTSSPGDAHLAAIQAFTAPDHVLFGTDGGWTNPTQVAITIQGLMSYDGFDSAQRSAVERDNALRLFPRIGHSH